MAKAKEDKGLAHVVPLMAFLIFMGGMGFVVEGFGEFFRNHSSLPWWRREPDQWIYPLQSVLCLALLAFWWKHYDFNWSRKGTLIGVVMGAVGIGCWLLPTQLYEWLAFTSDDDVPGWLQKLGVQERREGFDARMFGPNPLAFDVAADWTSLALRFFRAVIIVSLVEEIFWRGFLMRWLLDRDGDYWRIPFGKPSCLTYAVTTLAFMLAHAPIDYAGAIAFGSIMYLVAIWTKSLGACVVMHAVANFLMGWYAVSTGKLGLW
ncbi:CAAX prenyl protease-related protein [Roseibacillus ishigakijimensis]|uniref:CAAX prenyl protease-related protein n=1 Tax=Roseibacillus ishigakijimensis TaxID=454146 RepID=A0A934RSQ2_9BACT|nr:CAAX prenyl protease-related protein [Roseibacillus ishigakijimensis]